MNNGIFLIFGFFFGFSYFSNPIKPVLGFYANPDGWLCYKLYAHAILSTYFIVKRIIKNEYSSFVKHSLTNLIIFSNKLFLCSYTFEVEYKTG